MVQTRNERRSCAWRGGLARAGLLTAVVVGLAGQAAADEPRGCESFKWPVQREVALLQAAGKPVAKNGTTVKIGGPALTLPLVDLEAAELPMPPERSPKTKPSKAGYLRFEPPPAAGSYQVTISEGAWIDVVQDGHYIKPTAFSGAVECPGVRKSLRVTLGAGPVVVQISGTASGSIDLVALPVVP